MNRIQSGKLNTNLVRWMLRLLTCFFIMPIGILYAQTISVAPSGYITTGLGGTKQYTATVSGLTSTDVTWYAGGKVGGNATAGTISTTGLYTAPMVMPGQNPVAITAVAKAKPSLSATVYICLLNSGPTITAVAPNPIHTGNLTVTISGSGFVAGATVLDTTNGSGVQLTTATVTANTVVANGWQANGPTATFVVTNPGSTPSNAIIVPIASGESSNYTLTVVNGSGGGSYASGAVASITANAPPPGQSFVNWTGAAVQNPNATSTTLVMPAANTTVTAHYTGPTQYTLTVNNGSGSGSYTAGAVVNISANAPQPGYAFATWTGAAVQNPAASATTITMPAANASVTATYSLNATIPYPVTTHPRLWVTVNDVPRLQSWANASNPIYAKGMAPLLQTAVNVYNTQFFPNGIQNPNYPDPGDTQGYQGYLTEQYGVILAFNSLIDPNSANRIKYAQYARNMLMVAMNQAALGVLANAPFRDPLFPVYNRGNGSGEQWPLIVDWIYNAKDGQGNNILTNADKLTIRNVFMIWANECLNASTTGGDHPSPIGATNNLQLLPGSKPYRMASNNYYLGHARLLTMMALSVDPSDDPAINPGQSLSTLGNSLRSYILNANGAWLFQTYAMMGEPANIVQDYGIGGTGAGFGLSSGGLPPEGMLYGHSYAYILGQLLALQTAGFNDPTLAGPQIHLIGAPIWDRFVKGYMSSMTPTATVPPSEPWLGPTYGFGSYGDILRLYVTPDSMQPFALLSLLEQENGQSTHANAARWFSVNAVPGGAAGLYANITQPFSWSTTQSLLYYMLMDPTAAAGTDPRPTFSTNFVDPAAGRILAHSDWTANGTMFDYRASWESINHQDGDGGQFEFFRNGEWLTKEMSNYDNNGVGLTTKYHNTLSLQNWCANGTPNLNWFETGEWANGSDWILGLNAGDPVTATSNGLGYTYASSDLTKLYNRPNIFTPASAANDISQATRSILWLNNDYIVIYDRATSVHTGLFKRFNLSLVTNPTINGNVATEKTASGQQLFVQTLLPLAPSITSVFSAGDLSPIAELEPTRFVMTVQDMSLPTDTRFLHVLQGADKGAAMAPATHVNSASGSAFDGAIFGSSAVYFPVSASAVIATTTFVVPATVHTFIVTGLKAGTSYGIATQSGPNGVTVTLTVGGAGSIADSAGLLKVAI